MSVLNDRISDYRHTPEAQEDKSDSLKTSKKLVQLIQKMFGDLLESCEEYEPTNDLRIHGAPAVKLPNGKLVISPDLKCKTKDGKVFWIEVKDKCQRFLKPDTGADLHQILGFYQINKILKEPVLMIFKDASLDECSKDEECYKTAKIIFQERWKKFEGKPYGNWLDECIKILDKQKYPLLAFDRTRKDPIFIYYFPIENLKLFDETNLLLTLDEQKADIQDLCAYRKKVSNDYELHDFSELLNLSIENLTLVTSKKKYSKTPIIDIEDEHIEWFVEHPNTKYNIPACRELERRKSKNNK